MEVVRRGLLGSPAVHVLFRVQAIFMLYSVMMRFNVMPIVSALACALVGLAVSCSRLCTVKTGPSSSASTLMQHLTARVGRMAAFHGLWMAVNFTIWCAALGKLHPIRMVVGEHVELGCAALLSPLLRWTMKEEDTTLVTANRSILFFSSGLWILGLADNIYNYMPQDKQSDLYNVMDSVGGITLIVIHYISDVFRKRFRNRLGYDDDDFMAHKTSFAAASAALTVVVTVTAVVTPDVLTVAGHLNGVVPLVISAFGLVGLPLIIEARHRAGVKLKPIKPQVRFLGCVVIGFLFHWWYHVERLGVSQETADSMMSFDHLLIVCSAVLFFAGIHVIVRRQQLAGNSQLDPLSLFAGDDGNLSTVVSVFDSPKQRKLTMFLALTLGFMMVELLYGIHVNSLGLVSDSFHMLLDSASIAIGLYAAHMSSWRPNSKYTYGYGRCELLSGFTNGVLLLFIAVYILLESLQRIVDPPDVGTDYLLHVSIGGLVINIVGVVFFHEAHAGHSHGGHGHSHGDHGDHGPSHTFDFGDPNLRGVYLHILADLLGSVGVIISSLVVHFTGYMVADPVCSGITSCLIFLSAFPLLQATGSLLMLRTPHSITPVVDDLQRALEATDGVVQVTLHVWQLSTTPIKVVINANLLISAVSVEEETRQRARRCVAVLKDYCGSEAEVEVLLQIEKQGMESGFANKDILLSGKATAGY